MTNLNVIRVPTQFTAQEVDLLLKNLDTYTSDEQGEILKLVEELETR